MAQEKYAYESNTGDLFADDDPLAELARIVGYEQPSPRSQAAEPAPVRAPEPAAFRPAPAAARTEPAFDLEDELLKEFERYDAPELDPSASIPVDAPVADQWSVRAEVPAARVEPRTEPVFHENPVPVPHHIPAPQAEEKSFSLDDIFARQEPVAEPVEEDDFSFDLADELERAVAVNDDAPEPVVEARTSGLRLPLSNFQPARREPAFVDEKPAPVEDEPVFTAQPEPAFDVDHFDSREEPEAVAEVAPQPEPVVVEPEAAVTPPAARKEPEAPVFDDVIADDEFDLALDGLEIDLSDIVLDEIASVEPEPAPKAVQPVVEAKPAVAAAVAKVEEPESVWAEPMPTDGEMPFDASQIADPDYAPEAITEMDVPELPKHEPEQARTYQPAFDADFDADIADLLQETRTVAAATVAKPAEAPQTAKPVAVDLDDFSLMMGEDFRESVDNPLGMERGNGRVVIDPDNMEAIEPEGRNRLRTWSLAAAASVAVLAGATGVYAWLHSGGSAGVAGNGGPPVVVADSEPVKVAPENPGGKTVPNQDKAVYDRVAGGTPQAPTQKSLISSSEEPMDVVQRTLSPENFPLERAEDEDAADAQDQRLQPDGATETAAVEKAADANVSLRKVRTMIVRPDGTLVAREVEQAPAQPAQPTHQQTAAALPGSSGATAPSEPLRPAEAPVTDAASNAALSQAAASTVASPAASRPATTERAPVPSQRPAEQPVNVVGTVTGQGNVRPATAEAAPQQVASATPSTVATTAAPAGAYVVQIASLPSQAEAEKSYKTMSSKYGSVIGGRGVDIKAADIPGKGTFYRVRIVAGSKDEANALCGKLKTAGGSCLVTR